MVAHVSTVAFHGIEAREVDVQVHMASGLPTFTVVGLPDKAVGESRERLLAATAQNLKRLATLTARSPPTLQPV